ncbi:MAG: stage V sporulation protein B [Clostridia bacterium]|nr:stage V sporulation protein B [Clostridia bacterium]
MRQGFFRGALILMIGSAISRILGFVYRIYIVRLLGPEGIGLYEMVFPVITLILVLTTAGIPVALAKMIADDFSLGNERKVARILKVSLLTLMATGILFPALLMYGAPRLVPLVFSDPRAYWPFMSLIPALFLVSISSILRGYFQGINFMLPLASGQLFEQVVRIAVGLTLVTWLLPFGVEFGALGLSLAVVAGEAAGLGVLLLYYLNNRPKIGDGVMEQETPIDSKVIVQQLVSLAVPVTMSRIVSSLMLSAKAIIIPNQLQSAGVTLAQATQLYGVLSGMAMSLISFPSVITGSLSSVLLPATAAAVAKKEFKQVELRINQAVKLTVLTALPFTVWFILLAEPLTMAFFNNREAAIPLRILAMGCIFFYLQQTSSGMLYGLGKMKTLLINSVTGNSVGLVITYLLTGMPALGIKGAALGILAGAVITCILNLASLFNSTSIKLQFSGWLFTALLAAAIMAIFTLLVPTGVPLIVSLLGSGSCYLLILLLGGGLRPAEFRKG